MIATAASLRHPRPQSLSRRVRFAGSVACRRKFLRFYPRGFRDPEFHELERGYKWKAHLLWQDALSRDHLESLLQRRQYQAIAHHAVRIESRTNLLFSFEKMALRDAVKAAHGAKRFSTGLHRFLHGDESDEARFNDWCDVISRLPRRQTRVLTWPIATVFGFIAQPAEHFFLKPMVTRIAARRYGFPFEYSSKPSWTVYREALTFARAVRRDTLDMKPRDMIDLQSFIWVQGSDEYAE